jgi:hypothetical protein
MSQIKTKKSQKGSHGFLPESLLGFCFDKMQMLVLLSLQLLGSYLWYPEIFVKEMIVSYI